MHHFCILRKISLILCLTAVIFGCATNKSGANIEIGFNVTADGTSEGIVVYLSNIPEDTVSLSLSFLDVTEKNQIPNQIMFWNNDYFGFRIPQNELAELRETLTVLCPFAKNGHEYIISVQLYNNKNLDNWLEYSTIAIANGGIYMINNPSLYFTDENRNITLSEMPTFSEVVEFSQDRGLFIYNAMVKLDELNSRSGGGNWNEFTYPIHKIYNGSQEHFGFTGLLSVVGSVQCNLIHKNLEWIVGVTTTEEVIISF